MRLIDIGTHVVVDRKYIGTVTKVAVDRNQPDEGSYAIYLIERDTFFGTKTDWVSGHYLHIINSEAEATI